MARSSDFPNGVVGHVVSMTLDHINAGKSYSVATCQCGWTSRVRRTSMDSYDKQDRAIEAHWRGAAAAREPDPPA